jgi:hypothetical protein
MAYVYSPTSIWVSPTSSEIDITPYKTTVTTRTNVMPVVQMQYTTPLVSSLAVPVYDIDYDTGMNDNYLTQKEMTKWMLYRILDKWLYKPEMSHILKYLKVSDNSNVKLVTSKKEYDENKIADDSIKTIEKKADWIEENLFGISEMRSLLKRSVEELNYKWYDLPYKETFIVDAVERTLKKKLKEKSGLNKE